MMEEKKSDRKQRLFEPEFEKEPLRFKGNSYDNDNNFEEYPELEKIALDLQDKLEKSASGVLYRWKNVPVVLPPSLIGLDENSDKRDETKETKNFRINYADLFKKPTFNELDELAVDKSGKTKKLSQKQLDSIRKEGKFQVDSVHFPGKTHEWKLNRIIQKGYDISNHAFFASMSFALKLIIVTAKNRFAGNYFSILDGLRTWKNEIFRIFDLLFGLRKMNQVPYEEKLHEELQKFIVQELTVDPNDQKVYDELCKEINLALRDKKYHYDPNTVEVPYFYLTPEKTKIDLRLFDRILMERVQPVLKRIMKNSDKDLEYLKEIRSSSMTQLKNDGLSDEEAAANTTELLEKEYTKRVMNDIMNDQQLDRISPGIGKLLCNQFRGVTLISKICDQINKEMNQHLANFEAKLRREHKFRALIHEWLSEKIAQEKQAFVESHRYAAFERSIKILENEDLPQFKYLMERELKFLKEREPELMKIYLKDKVPARNFTFYRAIWFPQNWIITKSETDGKITYHLEKYAQYHNDTSYPFWRWANYIKRTWVHISNSIYFFGMIVPFVSPMSFRAMLSIQPYFPNKVLNTKGELVQDNKTKFLTFASRMRAIWADVFASRAKFEMTPDKGLLGKTISRFFNRVWNYIIKGAVGSLLLTAVFPPLCLVVSTVSLVIGLTSPLWLPILNLVLHVVFLLIFDFDYSDQRFVNKGAYLFPIPLTLIKLVTLGIAQPILALVSALVVCPVASVVTVLLAVASKVFDKVYDDIIYHTVLKRAARIPSYDTFVARRTAGPGLASDYFFQIKPEQALAALEAHLEIKILNAYFESIQWRLNEPIRLYSKFFNPIFGPFSYGLVGGLEPFNTLQHQATSKINHYRERIDKRVAFVNKIKTNADLSKIRLTDNDLEILLAKTRDLVEKHFTETILPYKNKTVADLFAEKGIEDNDWTTFAGKILEEIFGSGILTPLEETHNYFTLQVDHLNLEKYARMIADSELRDDLDKVHTVYRPKRGHIPINIPQTLDLGKFEARANQNMYYQSDPIRREKAINSNLTNPTTLPNESAIVAVITHNHQKIEPHIEYSFSSIQYLQSIRKRMFNDNSRRLL